MITIPELHYGDILEMVLQDDTKEVFQVVRGDDEVYLVMLDIGEWAIRSQSLEGLNKRLNPAVSKEVKEVKHIPSNKAQITISELPTGNATVIVKEAPSK